MTGEEGGGRKRVRVGPSDPPRELCESLLDDDHPPTHWYAPPHGRREAFTAVATAQMRRSAEGESACSSWRGRPFEGGVQV